MYRVKVFMWTALNLYIVSFGFAEEQIDLAFTRVPINSLDPFFQEVTVYGVILIKHSI